MRKYLMVIAALSLMLSGCGKDEEPMQEQAAEETAMEQEAGTAEEAAMEEQETDAAMDSMQEETGTAEEEGAGMEQEAAPAADEKAPDMTQEENTSMDESSPMAEEVVAEAESAAGDTAQGKQIYDKACFTCHAQGVAGAPKIGDKALWEPRIAKGMDTLVNHAINGFQGESGVMPPKGGFMNLSDEEVRAAVAYMVAESQ